VLAERGGRVPALVGERDVLPVLLDEFDASTMFTCFWTSSVSFLPWAPTC
jgi:hypothetical protein